MKWHIFGACIYLSLLLGSVTSCAFVSKKWDEFGIMKAFDDHSLEPAYFKSSTLKEEVERKRKQHQLDLMLKLIPSFMPEKQND